MTNRGFVYNVYIKHLLDNDKRNLANHLDNVRFDAWFLHAYNTANPDLSAIDLTFQRAVRNTQYEYLGALKNANLETISDIDGLESETTYEGLFDVPVSAYLFSNQDKPQTGTLIERDIYYNSFDYSVYSAKRYNYDLEKYPKIVAGEGYSRDWVEANHYGMTNKEYTEFVNHFSGYDFGSGYNPSEYRIYSINEQPVCESQTNLKVDSETFVEKDYGFVGNGILVTWYRGERANENETEYTFNEPKSPNDCIPCAYFRLPKEYKPTDKKVKVQWSENGLFSVT